jgi:hypothetical protein
MKQQTAVEWLIEQCPRIETTVAYNILEETKQMEKEQIKKAFEFGVADAYNYNDDEGEEYYNQTYNNENTNGTSTS